MNSAILAFQDVTKWFTRRSEVPLFNQLSFCIAPGSKVLVVGENGAGKSTLLKLAAGYLEPNAGRIRFLNSEVKFHREKIGLMLSHHFLYLELTGFENLELSARLYACAQPIAAIHKSSCIWGLESLLKHKVGSYSNGQKTLLALARATIHEPSLLLLDEPSVYLDENNLLCLLQFIKQSTQTILVTSQERDRLLPVMDRTFDL